MALLVKQDQERTDLVSAYTPPFVNPRANLNKTSTINTTLKTTAISSATPNHTPPATPTSLSSGSTTSFTASGSSLIAPSQGGLASSLGTASLASSGLIKPSKAKKKKTKVRVAIKSKI